MKIHINWSALGLTAALICAIHCALLPLLITTLPLLGINWIDNIYFEAGMITTALTIGILNLSHGYRRHHHRILPITLFLTGMALLIVKHFFSSNIIWLLIPSSFSIILAYYLNWKFCRIAKHCHATDCNH